MSFDSDAHLQRDYALRYAVRQMVRLPFLVADRGGCRLHRCHECRGHCDVVAVGRLCWAALSIDLKIEPYQRLHCYTNVHPGLP
jgi:hypothetical protein